MTETVPEPVTLDLDEMARSLTGFDEVAIERYFLKGIGGLTGGLQARALLFVDLRRGGAKDKDAFTAVMQMRLGDVESRFDMPDEEAEEGKG